MIFFANNDRKQKKNNFWIEIHKIDIIFIILELIGAVFELTVSLIQYI